MCYALRYFWQKTINATTLIISDKYDLSELFNDFSYTYLRNFIINLDEAGYESLENDSGKLVEVIDKFIEDTIYYQPRLFIYTTKPIYSTLPKPFQQKFKLITAPESNTEEAIIERVKSVVSENNENRFGAVDWDEYWEKVCVKNGMEISKEEKHDKDEISLVAEEQPIIKAVNKNVDYADKGCYTKN